MHGASSAVAPPPDVASPPATASRRKGRFRGRTRTAGFVLLCAFAFLGLWGIVDLVRIQRDLSDGQRILKSAGARDLGQPGGVKAIARRADDRLEQARRRARSSVPFVLARPIPIVGQQVAALRHMTQVAATVGRIGTTAADAVQARLDSGVGGGPARVALVTTIVDQMRLARGRLAHISVPNDRFVLPPLRGARAKLSAGLANAQVKIDDGLRMASGLEHMFVGPSRYLILGANNAEMRSGGMPLSAGVAEIKDGSIKLGQFVQTGDLWRVQGVAVPKNVEDLYGWMGIGQEWRATTATPDFPLSASLYSGMSVRAGLGPVDGVMLVDVAALRAVMESTGPVDHDGVTYTPENIEQQLLNEDYIRFGDQGVTVQDDKHDLQSAIGTAIFDALNNRPLKLGKLVTSLSDAGRGRHLLAWSRDPAVNEVWQRAGVSGAVPPNGFMINLENISANKLDWYIRPQLALRTLWTKGKARRIQLSVTFSNAPRQRTSPEVEGLEYDSKNGMAPGEHRVFLVAYLPRTAFDITSTDPPFSTAGIDAQMRVVGFRYGVKVGESRTVTINFTVPANQVFALIPTARAHPVEIVTPHTHFTDALPRQFRL